jgi:hypothetical protein
VRTGIDNRDISELERITNNQPRIQIFDDGMLETEEPEQRRYYCAKDKSLLSYLNGSETVWRCDECLTYHDTKIQDSPLKNIDEYALKPYTDLQYYPTYDERDPTLPFIEGIEHNTSTEEYGLQERQHENQRVQRIRVSGSFAEAIRSGALSSKTRGQQQEELEE